MRRLIGTSRRRQRVSASAHRCGSASVTHSSSVPKHERVGASEQQDVRAAHNLMQSLDSISMSELARHWQKHPGLATQDSIKASRSSFSRPLALAAR
eukprot:1910149-Rhodomonas_salina.2